MAKMITHTIREVIEKEITDVQILYTLKKILDRAEQIEKRKIICDFEFGMLYQRHDDTMTGEKYFDSTYKKIKS